MPMAAYFRNVGAVLLALLLVANYYLPRPAVVARANAYPPVIRIHSVEKFPDRIDFDTTQTSITVAASEDPDIEIAAIPDQGGLAARRADVTSMRSALALASQADLHPPASVEQPRRQVKSHRFAARTKKQPRPRMIIIAQPRQVDWFGFRQF
jgi:hypothetical protein